jgi:hypothetical protein
MGHNSAQRHSGLTTHGPAPGLGLRPLASLRQPGATRTHMAQSCHTRPWLERARWRAHRRLNDGGDPEQIEGKRSLNISLHATIRKPRMWGRERGAHRQRRFCSDVRADRDEAPVRGRRRGRCGRRSGQGGSPWWCGTHSRVGGATGRLLVQEGCGNRALLLVRSNSSEAAQRWRATTGEAAAGAD